jgi:hypothetical protein
VAVASAESGEFFPEEETPSERTHDGCVGKVAAPVFTVENIGSQSSADRCSVRVSSAAEASVSIE